MSTCSLAPWIGVLERPCKDCISQEPIQYLVDGVISPIAVASRVKDVRETVLYGDLPFDSDVFYYIPSSLDDLFLQLATCKAAAVCT